MAKPQLRVVLVVLVVGFLAAPAAAARPPVHGPARSVASTPEDPLALREVGTVPGGRVLYDPAMGRTIVVPTGKAGAVVTTTTRPAGATPPGARRAYSGDGGDSADEYDPRLAGHRRNVYYPPAEGYEGPGAITTIAGGACDGALGPQVAVDPQGVVADSTGRLFWLDHNDGMHLKGLPYVRTMDAEGRVRTLGNLGGPLTGRFWRDGATSSGVIGLVPDQSGGVYFYYQGDFSIQWQEWWTDQGDDVPVATVIGHLDGAGHETFVSGTPLTPGQNNGYGTPSGLPNGDGGAYADAAYYFIDSFTADERGNLLVVDGNIPGFGDGANGASAQRQYVDPASPQSHTDSRPVVVRYLNRSTSSVTFYAGTKSELTIKPGQVETIAGSRSSSATPPLPGQGSPVGARDAKFTFSSGITTDALGDVFLLQVGDAGVQVIAINTGSVTRRLYGVDVPAAQALVVAGTGTGYGGDGGPAVKAVFDVRDADHWYFGGLTRSADGALIVTDTVNNRVRRIDPKGVVTTLIGTGTPGFNGDGKPAAQTQLAYPMGAAQTPAGIAVADWLNARIRLIDEKGMVRTVVGTGSASLCGDGGAAAGESYLGGAGIGQPHDAVRDSHGNTYIADVGLGVVRKISPEGRITTVVGKPFPCVSSPPYVQGMPACPSGNPAGDGGAPEKATLQAPTNLLLDRWDNLYISDGAQVRYVNFGSKPREVHAITVAPHTITTVLQLAAEIRDLEFKNPVDNSVLFTYHQLIGLAGLALTKDGTLYVSDLKNYRVMALNWCGSLSVVAGNGTPPELGGGTGDGGPAVAASLAPAGLAWDEKRGLLFIASVTEGRIRAVNLRSVVVPTPSGDLPAGFIQTFAGGAPCNQPIPGLAAIAVFTCYYGDGGQATDAAINGPTNLSVQPDGRLFITDSSINVIRVVEKDGTIGTLAGVAPEFYGSDIATALWSLGGECGDHGRSWRACLGGVTGASLTSDGDLLVSESSAGRVRRITDALTAPLRPLTLAPPVKGANWGFTSPLRLRDQQGDNGESPSIAFDSKGVAYVIGAHWTHDNTPVGCDLWRYRSNVDAHGHDGYDFLGDPDAPLAIPLVAPTGTAGASCSLAVSRGSGVAVSLPPGSGDRISYSSESSPDLAAVFPSYLQNVTTGSSRDGGSTFVSSPIGVVSGTLQVSSAQLGVDGPDTNYLTYCCESLSNQPEVSTVNIAVSVGGQEYTRLGAVAPIDFPRRTLPQERNFVGAPIIVKGTILVPYYVSVCTSSDATVCSTTFPSDSRLYVARSTDGGKTFSDGDAVFSIPCTTLKKDGTSAGWVPDAWCEGYHGIPQVVADAGGALHAVWDDEHHVYLSTSRDLGRHWTQPARVDHGLSVSSFATIAAGDSGRVDIAWLGSTNRIKDPAARDAEWYVYMAQSLNADDTTPEFTQTLVSDHRVHRGVLCQRGSLCFGNGTGVSEVGNWFRLAVSPVDGRAVIAYGQDAGVPGQGTAAGILATRQCDGGSLLLAPKDIPCAPGGFLQPVARVPVACAPQGHDPQGDAELDGAQAPELDLRSLSLEADRASVHISVGVGAAPPAIPPSGHTGEYWTAYWHYDKLNYYVQAATPAVQDAGAAGATMSYSYGIVNDKGGFSRLGKATGQLDGTRLSWTVPADRVGSPKPGTVLSDLQARTDALSGATPDTAASLSSARTSQVDMLTADFGYDPGLACSPGGPAAPAPATAPAPRAPKIGVALPAPRPQIAPSSGSPTLAVTPSLAVAATDPAPPPAAVAEVERVVKSSTRSAVRAPVELPALVVLAPSSHGTHRTPPVRSSRAAGASTAMLEVPLLPCNRVPPPADAQQRHHSPPPPVPPTTVTQPKPPQVAVAVPPEPPLTPVGPAPAPAPAPQPQPGPANQAQAQQQVSSQTQPGQQIGIVAVPDPVMREARAYAATRHTSPYPSAAYLWAWTFALLTAGGALAARQRRLRPARAYVRPAPTKWSNR